MIEYFLIKVDKNGRIVIPKNLRKACNINSKVIFGIKKESNGLLLTPIEDVVTIDSYGRILIPKNLRKEYSIFNDSSLLLSITNCGIQLQNSNIIYQKIINKLKTIENNYGIDSILTDNNGYQHISEKYRYLENLKISDLDNYLKRKKIEYRIKTVDTINNYSAKVYIICTKYNVELLDLIYMLL